MLKRKIMAILAVVGLMLIAILAEGYIRPQTYGECVPVSEARHHRTLCYIVLPM